MSFFKKMLQSVLNEEDGNKELITEKSFVEPKKANTKIIIDRLKKGSNGIPDDEYEEYDKMIDQLLKSVDNLLLEEEDDNDSNYRDKDKEARENYIKKMKKISLIKIKKKSDKDSNKGDSGKKSGSKTGGPKESGDWGLRTSERNLHREIGGMERDYKKELFLELQMRSNMRRNLRRTLEALRTVLRRRLRRMHINRGFFMRFHRTRMNLKILKKRLKKIGCILQTRNINKIKNIKISKIIAINKRIKKARKTARQKRMMYYRAVEENKKKYLEDYKKAQKNVVKQQKASRNIGISM